LINEQARHTTDKTCHQRSRQAHIRSCPLRLRRLGPRRTSQPRPHRLSVRRQHECTHT
jgi:hypothetical protein